VNELPDLKASDADRERAIESLREHRTEGRLTLEEFAERVDTAYAARTVGELDALTRDLPARRALPVSRRKPVRWIVTVIGESKRSGRWRVGRRLRVVLGIGECVLDLRGAELEADEVAITVLNGIGETTVIVPEHVGVELGGFILVGSRKEVGPEGPLEPGAPLVRVRVIGLIGEVKVRRERRS
jgi:hypothetical protein